MTMLNTQRVAPRVQLMEARKKYTTNAPLTVQAFKAALLTLNTLGDELGIEDFADRFMDDVADFAIQQVKID